MGVRGQPTKWAKWYSTARWARIRRHQLREQPLCAFCLERGIVTAAEICDHVEPHHGEPSSLQSRGRSDERGSKKVEREKVSKTGSKAAQPRFPLLISRRPHLI